MAHTTVVLMQVHRDHVKWQMHCLKNPYSQEAHGNGCWTYRVEQPLEFLTPIT